MEAYDERTEGRVTASCFDAHAERPVAQQFPACSRVSCGLALRIRDEVADSAFGGDPRASVGRGKHPEELNGKVEHLGEGEERARFGALVAYASEQGPGLGKSVRAHGVSVSHAQQPTFHGKGVFDRD